MLLVVPIAKSSCVMPCHGSAAEIKQRLLDLRLGCLLSDCMNDAVTVAFVPLIALASDLPECTRVSDHHGGVHEGDL
jgi:hypothetical protein